MLLGSLSTDSSAGTWCAQGSLSCGTGPPASSRLRWVQTGCAGAGGTVRAAQHGPAPCPCAQHDDLHPVILRRRSSSDLAKQKFGTMPLVPLHGDSTDATMLSANQTLVKPHSYPCPQGLPHPPSSMHPSQLHAPTSGPQRQVYARVPDGCFGWVSLCLVLCSCPQQLPAACPGIHNPAPCYLVLTSAHLFCFQRRLHTRRTLSMFFVSISTH